MSARRSGVESGGYAFGNTIGIGGNTERSHTIVNMGVNIDQSRCNNLALCVEYVATFLCRDIGSNASDFRSVDRDVTCAGNRLRWIDDSAILYDQVIPRRRSLLSSQQVLEAGSEATHQRRCEGSMLQKAASGVLRHAAMLLQTSPCERLRRRIRLFQNRPSPPRVLKEALRQ